MSIVPSNASLASGVRVLAVFAGTAAVSIAVGMVVAQTSDPTVLVGLALLPLGCGALLAVRGEAAKRPLLISALAFSFVLSGWRRETGFIVLEPWLLLLPLCLVLWAGDIAFKRRFVRLDRIGMLAILIVVAAWLSYFGAVDMVTWLKRAMKITWLFALYLLLVNWVQDAKSLAALLRGALWGCAVAAATVAAQTVTTLMTTGSIESFGLPGTFANGNEAATYLGIFVIVGLALYASHKHNQLASKRSLFLLVGISMFGILLTRSRTGLLGVIAVSSLLFARTPRARRLVIAGFVLLGMLAVVPSTRTVMVRLLATVGMSGDQEYDAWIQSQNSARLYMVQVYWSAIVAYPVFGIGAGNYGFLGDLGLTFPPPPPDLPVLTLDDYLHLNSHNGFINWWVETGTIGFVAFIGAIVHSIFGLWRARRLWQRQVNGNPWWFAVATGTLGGWLMFVLTNMTGDFGVSEIRFWLLLALSTISIRGICAAVISPVLARQPQRREARVVPPLALTR